MNFYLWVSLVPQANKLSVVVPTCLQAQLNHLETIAYVHVTTSAIHELLQWYYDFWISKISNSSETICRKNIELPLFILPTEENSWTEQNQNNSHLLKSYREKELDLCQLFNNRKDFNTKNVGKT
jgi:hypothetical protein